MIPGVCIFFSPSVPFFASSIARGMFFLSFFVFLFFGERKGDKRERERRGGGGGGGGGGQCPSEKSINLARGPANVRTIRQRADWGGRGMGFEEIEGRRRGEGEGEGVGVGDTRSEPVSGERCSFVPHAIKPRRFYERGEPDDEVIYLPTPAGEGARGTGTGMGMNPCRDSLQGASIVSIKVAAFSPTLRLAIFAMKSPSLSLSLQSSFGKLARLSI